MAVQAIAGVSASSEAVVMTEYPSVSSGGIGQLLGSIYESIPSPFGLPKLSYIFTLPTIPLGLLLYFATKVIGNRYVLTNRAVQIWTARTGRKLEAIDLADFDHLELEQHPGQVFYNAADIRFVAASGETQFRLAGVKDAGAFKSAIERTVEARRRVQESITRIEARS